MTKTAPRREITRADFEGRGGEPLKRGVPHAADVTLFEVDGERVVLKDYRDKGWFWGHVVGVFLIWREARLLQTLAGMDGVPTFRGKPDRFSLVTEYIESRPVDRHAPDMVGNTEFADALGRIVADMHARGVVHLDMKHDVNFVVRTDGRPALLDFASGLRFSPRWFGGRWLTRAFGWPDRLAVLKWRAKTCPDDVSEADRKRLWFWRRVWRWLLPYKVVVRWMRRRRKDRERQADGPEDEA